MRIPTGVFLTSCLLLAACGDQAIAAAAEAKGWLGQASDAAKKLGSFEQAKTMFSDLSKSLGGIADGATAEQAKVQLAALVTSLKSQVGDGGIAKWTSSLGGAGDGLVKAAMDQIGKLRSNPDVQKVVGPVLEQLQGLLSAK